MTCQIGLRVLDNGAVKSLVPLIDGRSLIGLVTAFELAQGYTPSGAYGGVIPESLTLGDLSEYYLGTAASQLPSPGWSWLLACDSCGVTDCWPFEVRVEVTADSVTWSEFRQPHRPSWSYSDLGPFQFDRRQYETAIAEAAKSLTR